MRSHGPMSPSSQNGARPAYGSNTPPSPRWRINSQRSGEKAAVSQDAGWIVRCLGRGVSHKKHPLAQWIPSFQPLLGKGSDFFKLSQPKRDALFCSGHWASSVQTQLARGSAQCMDLSKGKLEAPLGFTSGKGFANKLPYTQLFKANRPDLTFWGSHGPYSVMATQKVITF